MDTSLLAGWENFYVIIGTSAGGLTGLTFVVIALVRDKTAASVTTAGIRVFVTPTIVHFGGVLAFAAFMNLPHPSVLALSVVFVLAGIAGVAYSAVIGRSMPGPGSFYVAVREDWIWNVIVPAVIYAALAVAGFIIWRWRTEALYAVAALTLALLFVGIRNAWDIAVYMTTNPPGGTS
jgi:hypothetical protein